VYHGARAGVFYGVLQICIHKDKPMISKLKAITIANQYLAELSKEGALELIMVGEPEVTEKGHLFYFNSRKWIEEEDMRSALFGNLPFLVNSETGDIEH
jgi:hypothetical protein